jgi:hypothetical protein
VQWNGGDEETGIRKADEMVMKDYDIVSRDDRYTEYYQYVAQNLNEARRTIEKGFLPLWHHQCLRIK